MFLTAFTWGFGVSCGLIVGLVIWRAIDFFLGGKPSQKDYNERSIDALEKRNETSVEMAGHLLTIASNISAMHEIVKYDNDEESD